MKGSDLEAGGRASGRANVGDGTLAAGEAEERPSEAVFDAEDVEDVQPQQVLNTPELPPHAVVETHRIDHWPHALGAKSAMKYMAVSEATSE